MNCINYYEDRKVWLVQPDMQPVAVSPYPVIGAGYRGVGR